MFAVGDFQVPEVPVMLTMLSVPDEYRVAATKTTLSLVVDVRMLFTKRTVTVD